MCCSVLQCVAVCCSVLRCVAVCCSVLQCVAVCCSVSQCVAVCRSVLQCASELQSIPVCCNVSHCVAVQRSVLQCVAVCVKWVFFTFTAGPHAVIKTKRQGRALTFKNMAFLGTSLIKKRRQGILIRTYTTAMRNHGPVVERRALQDTKIEWRQI